MRPKGSAVHSFKHGLTYSPAWNSWRKMKERCLSPSFKYFANYGGRGIAICDRWIEFANFVADMGQPPSKAHSLDRIDNDGDYSPDNCKWSTRREQCGNRRSTTLLTVNGETKTLIEWSRHTGLKAPTICQRITYGWTIEEAILTPAGQQGPRKKSA